MSTKYLTALLLAIALVSSGQASAKETVSKSEKQSVLKKSALDKKPSRRPAQLKCDKEETIRRWPALASVRKLMSEKKYPDFQDRAYEQLAAVIPIFLSTEVSQCGFDLLVELGATMAVIDPGLYSAELFSTLEKKKTDHFHSALEVLPLDQSKLFLEKIRSFQYIEKHGNG